MSDTKTAFEVSSERAGTPAEQAWLDIMERSGFTDIGKPTDPFLGDWQGMRNGRLCIFDTKGDEISAVTSNYGHELVSNFQLTNGEFRLSHFYNNPAKLSDPSFDHYTCMFLPGHKPDGNPRHCFDEYGNMLYHVDADVFHVYNTREYVDVVHALYEQDYIAVGTDKLSKDKFKARWRVEPVFGGVDSEGNLQSNITWVMPVRYNRLLPYTKAIYKKVNGIWQRVQKETD